MNPAIKVNNTGENLKNKNYIFVAAAIVILRYS